MATERCPSKTPTGDQCELEAGHADHHQITLNGGEVCHRCGSDSFEEWTMGVFHFVDMLGIMHEHDPNRRTCCNCGQYWYRPCPVCFSTNGLPMTTGVFA